MDSSHLNLRRAIESRTFLVLIVLTALPAFGQREHGEMRLRVLDPKGGALQGAIELTSTIGQFQRNLLTDQEGHCTIREIPFGVYHLRVSHQGFADADRLIEVRSEVGINISVTLGLARLESQIKVTGSDTLLDPNRAGLAYFIGSMTLNQRIPAQLGRSVTDAVDDEPGWLYEANSVLHPRGSEYDVQFVVDGLPLTENRSPAFAPPLESDDVESMRVMTAGFPAEYGRKLGGVVDVTTTENLPRGLHVTAGAEGGSFTTLAGDAEMGYAQGKNQFLLTGDGGFTDRYLDPPVIANYTNRGSTNGLKAVYSRELTDRDRLRMSFRHDTGRNSVPNELVQQQAGQRQDAADREINGQIDYDRVLSPTLLFSAESSLRDESFQLWSNSLATPVVISQQRGFTQGYGRVTLAGSHGAEDWKFGVDAIFNPVHEALQYAITNPSLFDPGTAQHFSFIDRRTDLEPAAFVQDSLHWKHWSASLGLRYDHYHFLLDQSGWSPRVAVARYFPRTGVLVHASYDRVFQTPAIENLLLASSPLLDQISSLVLRLPVEPARANYYEVGAARAFAGRLRVDVNLFRRGFRNYSDDDTLLNTGVSFPIADASARIEGIEGKLTVPRWGRFSGALSYANQLGIGQGPITGGLFIGSEAVSGVPDNSHFWVSQDQRNTTHARIRFEVTKRLWLATESSYGSGLPVELDTGDTNYNFLLAQYGPSILGQVDFARSRVRPSYSLDAGAGFDLYEQDNKRVSLQIQGSNLTNHLNLINFASLFSGTALAAPRSLGVRLKVAF